MIDKEGGREQQRLRSTEEVGNSKEGAWLDAKARHAACRYSVYQYAIQVDSDDFRLGRKSSS